jgi:hypothetical protein
MTGSITTWTRLESQGEDASMATGVKARLFDPMWLLTRQWQMGEFQAQDAGMPVQARTRSTTAPLSRLRPGPIAANTQVAADAFDPLALPMEALIERRPMRPADASDQRMLPLALDAGLHFLRMLEAQPVTASYRAAFIARFALQSPTGAPPDASAARIYSTMAGRALDGRLLAAAVRAGATQLAADPALAIAAGDRAATAAAATAWLAWYDGFCTEPAATAPDPWAADRMEYAVSAAARLSAAPTDEVTLTAAAIDDGRVDWSSFDLNAEVNMGSASDSKFAADVQTVIPAPITFRGGPAQRFWEMEDAQVAYGLTPTGPTDLAQLMMIEYASSYGGDWFVAPLDLAAGSVMRIESLVVTDSFGVRTLLRPIGDVALPAPFWSMWQFDFIRYPGEPAAANPVSNLFFLPPTAGRILDGGVLEEVMFVRDEMANIAWAIERQIESPAELARLRDPGPAPAALPASADAAPAYRLASVTPANWIPLLPVQQPGPGGTVIQRLRRGAALQPDGSNALVTAQGDILEANAELLLYDEDIPREGLRVTRGRHIARWIDGSTWLWTGYSRQVGRGEASSGLRFDQLGD